MVWSGNKAPEQETDATIMLATWVEDELERFSTDQLENQQALDLRPIYAAPLRPRQGMLIYADGSTYNPGSGEGAYFRNGAGVWVPVVKPPASSTDNALVRWDGTTGGAIQNSEITLGDSDGKLSRTGGISVAATNTNDDAAAGYVFEYVESELVIGSATALTTATSKTVTSISLTAGNWLVAGNVGIFPANTTSLTKSVGSISLSTNALDGTKGRSTGHLTPATVFDGNTANFFSIQPVRLKLTATTTVFLVAHAVFTVSTCAGYGIIYAWRPR